MDGQQPSALPPRALQIVGIVLLVGCTVFWMVTGKASVEFTSASMTLITLGIMWNAQATVTRQHRDYELPPEPRSPEQARHDSPGDSSQHDS